MALKSLFEKAFGAAAGSRVPAGDGELKGGAQAARLRTLVDFFPIGKKLRYYPEFKVDIVLDTLIVAYCVDGHYLYSGDAIERDHEGNLLAFDGGDQRRIAATAVRQFQLLVPDTSHLEIKLDYLRRAEIGRGKQFSKGNCITLISNAGGKGVSTVDTEVDRQANLPDGPYAHMDMVLLTPDLASLQVSDQRRKSRAKLLAPVILHVADAKMALPCQLVDISEGEVRLRIAEHGASMPPLQAGEGVVVEADLGVAERHYTLKGSVIRRSQETCVLLLEGQVSAGRYHPFTPLDLLELKAGLINYSRRGES